MASGKAIYRGHQDCRSVLLRKANRSPTFRQHSIPFATNFSIDAKEAAMCFAHEMLHTSFLSL
jgi:hypothetical protein